MTGGNAPFVYCANAFSLGVEAINDPMGSDQRPWWVPTLRVCPALKGREGHGDPGEWWEMIPTLPAPQWTPLTIALFMYTCPKWPIEIQEYYRTPIATAHSSGKKPPAAFRTSFLQYISDSGSFEKERVTHGYTTTHTNDPISPVKAAQTEIAPVLMCVSQSSIIQLCLFQMLSTKRCTDTLTVCTANRDIN